MERGSHCTIQSADAFYSKSKILSKMYIYHNPAWYKRSLNTFEGKVPYHTIAEKKCTVGNDLENLSLVDLKVLMRFYTNTLHHNLII